MRFIHTVTILTDANFSEGGQEVHGLIQRMTSSEGETEFVTNDWLLALPLGVEIDHNSRVIYEDTEFEVQGDPLIAKRTLTTGTPTHIEVNLKVTGESGLSYTFPDEEAF